MFTKKSVVSRIQGTMASESSEERPETAGWRGLYLIAGPLLLSIWWEKSSLLLHWTCSFNFQDWLTATAIHRAWIDHWHPRPQTTSSPSSAYPVVCGAEANREKKNGRVKSWVQDARERRKYRLSPWTMRCSPNAERWLAYVRSVGNTLSTFQIRVTSRRNVFCVLLRPKSSRGHFFLTHGGLSERGTTGD